MTDNQTPPQGPEYAPCGCGHIEPEHRPDGGPCLVCGCENYRPTAEQPVRIPIGRNVTYAVRGMPEVPNAYGPGYLVPREISLTYRATGDSQLGRFHAYVKGLWRRDGEVVSSGEKLPGQHYYGDPSTWPAWLAEEARLHDPAASAVVAVAVPPTGQTALRDRIAAALLARIKWATVSKTQPYDGLTSLLAANEFDLAAAVLAVLPAGSEDTTTTRANVLREAADRFDRYAEQLLEGVGELAVFVAKARRDQALVWREAARELRRLAAETPAAPCGRSESIPSPCSAGDWCCQGPAAETQPSVPEARSCACPHPADEHSIYGCTDGCGCEWMPKRKPVRHAPGKVILCPDCRTNGHSVCVPGGERPRCPHCQLPHDLTPSVQLACASIRASITDQAEDEQPDTETECPTPLTHNWGCGCPSDVAAAIASCPGHEMSPSPCRCPCYGCKHHCSAHQPAAVQTDEEATP